MGRALVQLLTTLPLICIYLHMYMDLTRVNATKLLEILLVVDFYTQENSKDPGVQNAGSFTNGDGGYIIDHLVL